MVLKLPWGRKREFWAFENSTFQSFTNFLVTKLKQFSGKPKQNIQNCLHPKLVIRSILENDFKTTLRWKTNVLRVQKKTCFTFLKIFEWWSWSLFSGKVRQNLQNLQNCLNPNLVRGQILENHFETTLRWKNNIQRVWNWHFSFFW